MCSWRPGRDGATAALIPSTDTRGGVVLPFVHGMSGSSDIWLAKCPIYFRVPQSEVYPRCLGTLRPRRRLDCFIVHTSQALDARCLSSHASVSIFHEVAQIKPPRTFESLGVLASGNWGGYSRRLAVSWFGRPHNYSQAAVVLARRRAWTSP